MFESQGFKIYEAGGIPVSVSLSFLLIAGLSVALNGLVAGTAFAAALFLSVLIHEYGHAFVAMRYGLGASILIHGFGGLCFHRPASSDGKDALVLVAGPLLEIVFGLLMLAVIFFVPAVNAIPWVGTFCLLFVYVSIVWGLINLFVPIYPLDGGRLFHLLLRRFMPETSARTWALRVSLFSIIVAGAFAVWAQRYFLILIVFMIGMQNWNMLQSGAPLVSRGSGRRKPMSDFGKELMSGAEEAFADEDWREAARLCHQLRASVSTIPEKQMNRIWEILGVSTAKMGEHFEALDYLKRAPQTAAVKAAREECEAGLRN